MQHWIASGGYAAVFLLMIAESACIPVPSELIMLFGGALAATGKLSLVAIIVLGALGNLVGSLIAWSVGRAGGRPAIHRWGRYIWLKDSDVDRAERWFERRGPAAVFVGRMLPVVRTFISLPAGVARMEPVRFGAYTLAGSIPWTAALGVAGYEIGSHWHAVEHGISDAGYVIAVLAVLGIAAALAAGWRRWKSDRRAQIRAQAAARARMATEA
ncbi:MAG: DedA family protein, partial [Acidimicrobiales bacterium]